MSLFTDASSTAEDAGTVKKNVPCDPTVYLGAAVKIIAGVAYNALADGMTNSNVLGVVQRKPTSTLCDIRVAGVTPFDVFVGLDETKEYFLSNVTAGLLTTVAPTSGTGAVILKMGQPFTATKFFVIKGIRMQLA